MSRFRKQIAAAALLQSIFVFYPFAVQAAVNNFYYDKSAISGKQSTFGSSMELDINCSLIKSGPPQLIEAPKHGVVIFSRSIDYPRFNRENPHYKCISKKYPSVRIVYQSAAHYRGPDHFVIEDISSLGDVNISSFDVQIQ